MKIQTTGDGALVLGDFDVTGKIELTTGTETGEATTKGYVDTLVGLSTAGLGTGLASITYVDEQVLGVSTVTDALVELSGVPSGSVGLGTFTQDIISDNVGIKSAFQELETSISQLQTSTTANNYKWSNTNDATIDPQLVTTNTSNWADATVVYIHRKARHNIDMKNALENMFILGAKMFIQRPDIGGKFFTAYISGAPTITGTGTDQVYAYPVSNVTTEGQITSEGMKINIGIFVDTNAYQVGLATAGLASTSYVNNLVAISTAGLGTDGGVSQQYVDQQVGLATAGLATEQYVDDVETTIIAQVGSLLTTSYYTKTQVDTKVGLATVGLVSTEYVDNAVAGVSTFAVRTTDLAVVNPFNASLTVGQDVNGTNVDHFGIYYGQLNAGIGAADIFTTNGDMNFWTDAGLADNDSKFQFGRDFGADVWMSLSDQGGVVSGILTATSFVGDGSGLTNLPGGALPSRSTLTGTTGVVNAGDTTLLTISGYKTYALQSIQVTQASWVRIYTDPASRLNDSSRLYTEDPQPGSGLIAEVRTETSGTSTFLMSPGVIGWNNNSTSNIYLAVTNNESSNLTITVNLQAVQMEA